MSRDVIPVEPLAVELYQVLLSRDGRGLDEVFSRLVTGPTMRELIDAGYLAEYVAYAPPTEADLSGVRKRAGEFAAGDAAHADALHTLDLSASLKERVTIQSPGLEETSMLGLTDSEVISIDLIIFDNCHGLERSLHIDRSIKAVAGFGIMPLPFLIFLG